MALRPGERVVVCMANCPEVSIVYQAVWRAGGVVTPATFLLSVEDLRHVIADSRASAVITTGDLEGKVREAVAGLHHLREVVPSGPDGLGALEEAEPAAIVPRHDDDLAALLYTNTRARYTSWTRSG